MKICQAYFGNVFLFFWKKKKEKSLFWEMSTFAFVLFCLKKKKKIHQGNFERWRLGWLYAIRPINFLYSNLKKHKQSLAQFCRLFKLHTQPTTANGYFSSLFSSLFFPPPLLLFLLHRFRRWGLFSLFLSSSRCLFSFFFTGASIQSPFFFSWVS